jgi:hypothetical protein
MFIKEFFCILHYLFQCDLVAHMKVLVLIHIFAKPVMLVLYLIFPM